MMKISLGIDKNHRRLPETACFFGSNNKGMLNLGNYIPSFRE